MTVRELIADLQTRNPDQDVTVWDAFQDCETSRVMVDETGMGLFITSK